MEWNMVKGPVDRNQTLETSERGEAGINSMHSQKAKQPYIRNAKKNRTRKKKSAVEEDPRQIPQKNLKK